MPIAGINIEKPPNTAQASVSNKTGQHRATGVKVNSVGISSTKNKKSSVAESTSNVDEPPDNEIVFASKSVVSGVGLLCTYLQLLREEMITERTREGNNITQL